MKHARAFVPFVFAALLAAGVHCAPGANDGEDQAAHTADEPVQVNSLFIWADVDYPPVERATQDYFAVQDGSALADDDPLARRLQAWVDRIDGLVRAEAAARGTPLLAPKPTIKVLDSPEQNAWVMDIGTCVPYPVEDGNGQIIPIPVDRCEKPRNWTGASAAQYAEAFNQRSDSCRFDAHGDRLRVRVGHDCAAVLESGVGLWATPPFVFYATAYLALSRAELTVADTIAHELGHYYRGHASEAGAFQAYWYEQTERPVPHKPASAHDSEELERRAFRFGARPAMPSDIVRVPEQRMSAYLTLAIAGVIADALPVLKADGAGEFACTEALDMADGRWRSAFYPGAKPNEEARSSYLRFETKLLACADRIRIGADFGDHTLPSGQYSEWLSLSQGSTLGAALGTANEALTAQERELSGWLDALSLRRLGRYTIEQEADEFSLEYLSKAGVDVKRSMDATFELMTEAFGKEPGLWDMANPEISLDECSALYRSGWKRPRPDGTSEYVFVPLGDLLEPHHGNCYRFFNGARELEAHAYRPASTPLPVEGEWTPFRQRAREINERRAAGAGGIVNDAGGAPNDGDGDRPQERTRKRTTPHRIVDGL